MKRGGDDSDDESLYQKKKPKLSELTVEEKRKLLWGKNTAKVKTPKPPTNEHNCVPMASTGLCMICGNKCAVVPPPEPKKSLTAILGKLNSLPAAQSDYWGDEDGGGGGQEGAAVDGEALDAPEDGGGPIFPAPVKVAPQGGEEEGEFYGQYINEEGQLVGEDGQIIEIDFEPIPGPDGLPMDRFIYYEEDDVYLDVVFELFFDAQCSFYYHYHDDGAVTSLHWNEAQERFQRVHTTILAFPKRTQSQEEREYLANGGQFPDQPEHFFRLECALHQEETGRYLDTGINVWWNEGTDLFEIEGKFHHWNKATSSYMLCDDRMYLFEDEPWEETEAERQKEREKERKAREVAERQKQLGPMAQALVDQSKPKEEIQVISLSTKNKGLMMLEKMGWAKGQGLGKKGSGILNALSQGKERGKKGLGFSTHYDALPEGTSWLEATRHGARMRYNSAQTEATGRKLRELGLVKDP